MTKCAVLVVGPESSGTRLVTRILVRAGCAGDDNHVQWLDWNPPDGQTPIVWRRSLPHDKSWPDLGEMVRGLRLQGYIVSAVVTDRLDGPMVKAQVRDHVKNEGIARQHIQRSRTTLAILDDPRGPAIPVTRVQYEDLVTAPEITIHRIIEPLGLLPNQAKAIVADIKIYDGNAQYTEEDPDCNPSPVEGEAPA